MTALRKERPLLAASSTDRCNTFCELLSRCLIEQGLSRPFIELPCDSTEFGLAVQGQIGATRKILAQQSVKFAGQSLRLLDQCRDNAFGILVRNLDQHHVARMALDKRCDITIARSTDQVALPMAWHRTIFNRRRSLANGYGILDLAEPVSFHAGVPGSADR